MKYIQVSNHLRSLATHELRPGDAIPSERELREQFQVARMTVRQAVGALVNEGILERVQGKGTFVAAPKVDLQVRLVSFAEDMARRGLRSSSRMLSADIRIPPQDVATALDLEPEQPTYYLHCVQAADDEPIALEENWLPEALFPGLFEPVPPTSLYGVLTERGFPPDWGEDAIDAAGIAPQEAELLNIKPSRPVLRIARRTFSGDTATVYTRWTYRGDRYTLWVPVAPPVPAIRRMVPSPPPGAGDDNSLTSPT